MGRGIWVAIAIMLAACATAGAPGQDPAPAVEHQSGFAEANGIRIAYQVDGPADGEPVIVVAGLAGQMSPGIDAFTQALLDRGFRVIRFDNRDAGLTTHMSEAGPPPSVESIVAAMAAGERTPLAYTVLDM